MSSSWISSNLSPSVSLSPVKCTWLHGFTSHLKVHTCTRQGTVVAGLTAARQFSSDTTLSLPWTNWTHDTALRATPRSQDTEQGDVLNTLHLDKWHWLLSHFAFEKRKKECFCLSGVMYLAGQLWVLHETTAVGSGKSLHSESSTTSSSPSVSLAQYSTLLATPPPHVTLQTPCLECHLVLEKVFCCYYLQTLILRHLFSLNVYRVAKSSQKSTRYLVQILLLILNQYVALWNNVKGS